MTLSSSSSRRIGSPNVNDTSTTTSSTTSTRSASSDTPQNNNNNNNSPILSPYWQILHLSPKYQTQCLGVFYAIEGTGTGAAAAGNSANRASSSKDNNCLIRRLVWPVDVWPMIPASVANSDVSREGNDNDDDADEVEQQQQQQDTGYLQLSVRDESEDHQGQLQESLSSSSSHSNNISNNHIIMPSRIVPYVKTPQEKFILGSVDSDATVEAESGGNSTTTASATTSSKRKRKKNSTAKHQSTNSSSTTTTTTPQQSAERENSTSFVRANEMIPKVTMQTATMYSFTMRVPSQVLRPKYASSAKRKKTKSYAIYTQVVSDDLSSIMYADEDEEFPMVEVLGTSGSNLIRLRLDRKTEATGTESTDNSNATEFVATGRFILNDLSSSSRRRARLRLCVFDSSTENRIHTFIDSADQGDVSRAIVNVISTPFELIQCEDEQLLQQSRRRIEKQKKKTRKRKRSAAIQQQEEANLMENRKRDSDYINIKDYKRLLRKMCMVRDAFPRLERYEADELTIRSLNLEHLDDLDVRQLAKMNQYSSEKRLNHNFGTDLPFSIRTEGFEEVEAFFDSCAPREPKTTAERAAMEAEKVAATLQPVTLEEKEDSGKGKKRKRRSNKGATTNKKKKKA